MESGVELFGHPVRPVLIPFPLGLLVTSFIFDIVYPITGSGEFSVAAFWMIAAGVVGGLAAAVFGAIDFSRVPDGTRAHSVGVWHALLSASMLMSFAVSWLLRLGEPAQPGTIPIILSLVGAALAGLTGWFGGELVGWVRECTEGHAARERLARRKGGIRNLYHRAGSEQSLSSTAR